MGEIEISIVAANSLICSRSVGFWREGLAWQMVSENGNRTTLRGEKDSFLRGYDRSNARKPIELKC